MRSAAPVSRINRSPARLGRDSLRNRKDARGFTLLELLIATAVGAVVLLVIQTAFFGALRLHNSVHERIDTDLELQRSLAIIRRDFAGLMLPGGVLSGQLQTSAISSSPGSESFGERVSPDIYTNSGKIDGWNPYSEVQMVSYFLAAPADNTRTGKDLVRVVKRNLLPVQDVDGDPQILLHGISEATVEFYDGMDWTPDWDSEATTSAPMAIRLRLVLASPDRMNQSATGPIELVVPVLVVTTSSAAQAADAAAANP